jgi:hypothetical protein
LNFLGAASTSHHISTSSLYTPEKSIAVFLFFVAASFPTCSQAFRDCIGIEEEVTLKPPVDNNLAMDKEMGLYKLTPEKLKELQALVGMLEKLKS